MDIANNKIATILHHPKFSPLEKQNKILSIIEKEDLTNLDLSEKNITDEHLIILSFLLKDPRCFIESIDLSRNKIKNPYQIFFGITEVAALSRIDFSNNQIENLSEIFTLLKTLKPDHDIDLDFSINPIEKHQLEKPIIDNIFIKLDDPTKTKAQNEADYQLEKEKFYLNYKKLLAIKSGELEIPDKDLTHYMLQNRFKVYESLQTNIFEKNIDLLSYIKDPKNNFLDGLIEKRKHSESKILLEQMNKGLFPVDNDSRPYWGNIHFDITKEALEQFLDTENNPSEKFDTFEKRITFLEKAKVGLVHWKHKRTIEEACEREESKTCLGTLKKGLPSRGILIAATATALIAANQIDKESGCTTM